jgi:hypothetical protein
LKSITIVGIGIPVCDNKVVARHIEKIGDGNVLWRYAKSGKLLKLALIEGGMAALALPD